jgi:hypothetical protein
VITNGPVCMYERGTEERGGCGPERNYLGCQIHVDTLVSRWIQPSILRLSTRRLMLNSSENKVEVFFGCILVYYNR